MLLGTSFIREKKSFPVVLKWHRFPWKSSLDFNGCKVGSTQIDQNISFNQAKEVSRSQSQLLPCSTRTYFSTLRVRRRKRRRREASWLSKLTLDFFSLQYWARQFRHKNKTLCSTRNPLTWGRGLVQTKFSLLCFTYPYL